VKQIAKEPKKRIKVTAESDIAKLLTDAAAGQSYLRKTASCFAWNGWGK
jgi:hypothetical protein